MCAVVGTRTDYELRETFDKLDKFDIGFFQNRWVGCYVALAFVGRLKAGVAVVWCLLVRPYCTM